MNFSEIITDEKLMPTKIIAGKVFADKVCYFSGFAAIIVRATLLVLAYLLARTLQMKDEERLHGEKRE